MYVSRGSKPTKSALVAEEDEAQSTRRITFYNKAPDYELSLDEFESYALKRIKVHRKMEQMNTTNRISLEDRTLRLLKLLKSEDLHNRRIDEASHFILRLSFCQTEELRRRFLENECGLLKFRLSELPAPELANAVQEYMHIAPVDASVLSTVESKLRALRPHNGGRAEAEEKFYVVPFTQALDLIARRECYLQAGRAYVPQSKVVAIVSRQFRAQLSRQLKLLAQHQNQWMDEREEKRLQPLLRSMHHWSHAKPTDYSDTGDAVALTADGMDEAVAHMPLCMRLLDQGMRQDKTLKHQGRVQYGFFLRTANMPEDELLRYFQKHFQQVTAEKFQKQYAPSFKHMYKDRGNTGGYTGYGCMKIINFHSPAKVGEHHGCPFKYNDEKNLLRLLQRMEIGSATDRQEIVDLAKTRNDFNLACVKHFHVTHPEAETRDTPMDNLGNHPNAWFHASIQYHQAKPSS